MTTKYTPIDFEMPPFETFFDYFSIIVKNQGKNADISEELADNWILEEHLKLDTEVLTMRESMGVISKIKSYKIQAETFKNQDEFEFDGFNFQFIDQPGTFYKTIKKQMKIDPKKGFYVAIINCYLVNNKPLVEMIDKLNFTHAGILVSNFSSFF